METHDVIMRCLRGQERAALEAAAERMDAAWLPYTFESRRIGQGRRKRFTIRVAPLMGYLFCRGSVDQVRHAQRHRSIMGPVWFVPDRSAQGVARWRQGVERAFNDNRDAWLRNERLFHCQFKRGQAVRLRQEGHDLFMGKFLAVLDDGRYEVEADLMGRTVSIMAEPGTVCAA